MLKEYSALGLSSLYCTTFFSAWPCTISFLSSSTIIFSAKKYHNTLAHPPHLPDLSLSDYFLFPKIKLKGRHFDKITDIQSVVTDQLKLTKHHERKLFDGYEKLKNASQIIFN